MKTSIMSVDLAARTSAWTVLRDASTLHGHPKADRQDDSIAYAPFDYCDRICLVAKSERVEVLLVEDVPYGISRQAMIRPPLQLQGALMYAANRHGILDRLWFVDPSTWQRGLGIFGKGKDAAAELAASYGYEPPDTLGRYKLTLERYTGSERSRHRERLKKLRTDYVDAYLLGYWGGLQTVPWKNIKGLQPAML